MNPHSPQQILQSKPLVLSKQRILCSVSSTLVILGIAVRFGSAYVRIGAALYSLGWILAATTELFPNTVLAPALLVTGSWFLFQTTPMPLVACSVLLGKLCDPNLFRQHPTRVLARASAAVAILLADYYILPLQRSHRVTDGIGLLVFLSGWSFLYLEQ